MSDEKPASVIEYRQINTERNLEALTKVVTGIAETARVMNLSLALMQDAQKRQGEELERHAVALEETKMDKQGIKAIYKASAIVCSCIAVIWTCATYLIEKLKFHP